MPLNAHLYDAGSYDPDGEIVKWEWNFGDAGGWHDYTATSGDAWHVYDKPGTKTAHLRVTDNDGNKDAAFVTIEMRWDYNAAPVAVAAADPASGYAPLAVAFSPEGSYDPDGGIVKYEWDFDDGAGFSDFTSSAGEATHTYPAGGTFTAVLRVTDDDGAETQASAEVEVVNQRGDWWMFGREPAHNRRSPFTGPKVGNIKWAYQTGILIFSSPAIAADGTILIGSGSWATGRFYAVNPDGSLKWSFPANGVESSPAIAADGTIYFGSGTGHFYALKPDGTLKWMYATGAIIGSSPAIAPDGTIYVGNRSGNLYAFRPDGTLKWQYNTGNWVYGSPAIGADGTVYIGSAGLQALNPSGTLKWRFGNWYVHWSSPSISADGTIYVGSENGYFYAVNPDGTERWNCFGPGSRSSPALGADGAVYVRGYDNYLYALSKDGALLWRRQTGNSAGDWPSSSPTIDADGTVYVGGWDNRIYAFTAGGDPVFTVRTANIVGSSAALGNDGVLYIGGTDGRLYAIYDGPPGMPEQPANTVATDGTSYDYCQVSWNAALLADDYKVYRASSSSGPFNLLSATTSGQTSYRDTTGGELVHYWYRVTAVNASGESQPSSADEGWRAAPPPPPSFPIGDWSVDLGGGALLWFEDIPLGPVQLGSPSYEWGHQANETPYQQYYVPAFSLGKYPVTNRQWKRFMDAGGYTDESLWNYGWTWRVSNNVTMPALWQDPNYAGTGKEEYPVVGLSWYESNAFANWVNRLAAQQGLGKSIRLPFEDEWERAAEGATERLFPWGDAGFSGVGDNEDWARCNTTRNLWPDVFTYTSPVFWFKQGISPFGVYDMAGNKWEWNKSRFTSTLGSPYQRSEFQDVGSPGLRGWGNWYDFALRTSFRSFTNGPGGRYADSAARLAAQ